MPERALPTNPHSRYESIQNGANRVGVSTRTLRRWIAAGQLTAHRAGPKLIRIDSADLDAVLRRIPTAGGPDAPA